MIKVKYLNDEKRISLPDKLEDFKKQVESLFKINSKYKITSKIDKTGFIYIVTNEEEYNYYVKDLIEQNNYILLECNNIKKYLNFVKSNSEKIEDLEVKINQLNDEIKKMSIKLSNKPKRAKTYNDINFPKQKKKYFLEKLFDEKIHSIYIANFLNNNDKCTFLYKNIMNSNTDTPKNPNNQFQPIEFTVYINNGNNQNIKWPDDTILKCLNDNTDVFFYHCKWKKNLTEFNGQPCYAFPIIFNFKTKKIELGVVYSCRYFLTSDSKGRIGNTYGQVFVEIVKDLDEMGEDDLEFMNKYKPEPGKIERGEI